MNGHVQSISLETPRGLLRCGLRRVTRGASPSQEHLVAGVHIPSSPRKAGGMALCLRGSVRLCAEEDIKHCNAK